MGSARRLQAAFSLHDLAKGLVESSERIRDPGASDRVIRERVARRCRQATSKIPSSNA